MKRLLIGHFWIRGSGYGFTRTSLRVLAAAVLLLSLAVSAGLLLSQPAAALTTVPTKMNFQGRLTDSTGNIKPNGNYNMRLKLYAVNSGGSAVWSEDRLVSAGQGIAVTNGLFSIQLGSLTPLPASLFASGALYLEVELASPATATSASPTWSEGPMTPRNQLATSAYAYNAETLDGLDSTAFAAASGSASYIQNGTSPQTASLNITGSAAVGGDTLVKTTTNSTTAFSVQNATGFTVLQADSLNKQVTVGPDPASSSPFPSTWGGSASDSGNSIVYTSDGGYAVAGQTSSYGAGDNDLFLTKYDAAGTLSWSRTWGGYAYEYASSLVQTSDGGYAVAGYTDSYGAGGNDMFLVKYDAAGTLSWSRTWGGYAYEYASSLVQTSDGGYAVAGYTDSYGAGNDDMFLTKYDAAGTLSWSRTWGDTGYEGGYSLVQTSDGGYAVTGYTESYGAGNDDMFLTKYDAAGTLSWSRIWGGTGYDYGESLVQTSDGGYAVTGYTSSYDTDGDMFLLKYDAAGTLSWNRVWGGTEYDHANSLVQTSDGGYAVAGQTNSYGAGNYDLLLTKYDAAGTLNWSRTWGGTSYEYANSLVQTSDSGYAVTGRTNSYGAGSTDAFLVKYDAAGVMASCDQPACQSPTATVTSPAATTSSPAASTSSPVAFTDSPTATTTSATVTAVPVELSAAAALRVTGNTTLSGTLTVGAPPVQLASASLQVFSASANQAAFAVQQYVKNPSEQATFAKIWGGNFYEYGNSLVQTSDGGYAVTGLTRSYGAGTEDMYLAKYDAAGTLSWSRTWGGTGADSGSSVVQTGDGGYAVTGNTDSYGAGGYDMFLAKYDASGTLSWSRTWGGTGVDNGNSIVNTNDGGYAVTGYTNSYGAGGDVFLAKYTSAGTLSWSRTWGGSGYDYGSSLIQTSDGGYAVTGGASEVGNDNVLLLKYDAAGTLSWSRTWGGSSYDYGNSLVQTSDGGYAVTGQATSFGAGSNAAAFLLKYDSAGTLSWNRTWGGTGNTYGNSLVQAGDNGYVVTGKTDSYTFSGRDDAFLMKYDATGTLTWSRTWGGPDIDSGSSLAQTSDGGYAVAGRTSSYGAGNDDMLLLKYDASGAMAGCDQPTCQSPTIVVSSPAATTGSPAATTGSPAATVSSPAATTGSPAVTEQFVTELAYGGEMQGTTSLLVDAAGNVGIGTTAPGSKLQVAGDTLITATSPTALRVQDTAGTNMFSVDTAGTKVVIGSATPDDSAVLLVIDSYNKPVDPAGVNGAMYYNTALGSFRCYENGAWRSCLGGLAAANTTTTGNTVASTAAETTFASSYTLPANACQPGRVLRVIANGVYGTTGITPTLNIRVKAGTTNLGATGAQTTTSNMVNRRWSVEFYVTCLTSGVAGSVEAQGTLSRHTSATAAVDWEMTNTAPVSLNTTTSQAIQLSAQWGTANAANTITLRQLIVESLGP